MELVARSGRDPRQLARLADQLEQLTPFLSQADSRDRLERAANLPAETALIEAARPWKSPVPSPGRAT